MRWTVKMILAIMVFFSLVNCSGGEVTEQLNDNPDQLDTILKEPTYLYEIPVDSFKIMGDLVKKNQFFSQILTQYGINYGTIDKMAREGKKVFDVRRMRAGKPYTVFTTNDSLEEPQIVVYEINKVEYVVYDLRDSLKIYRGKKPVTVETKTASGIITSSLY